MYLSDGKYLVVTSSQSQPAFYWKKSLESLRGRICIIDKNGFFLCQQKDTNVIQSIFYDISPPNNYIFGKGKASKLIQVNPKMEVPFPSNLGVLNPCWVLVPKYGRKVNSSLTTTWFSGLTSFVKKNWLLFRSNAILNYFSSIRVFSFYFTINNLHENPKMYFFLGWICLRKSFNGNCKNLDEICNLWQVIRVTFWRLPRLTWNEGGVSLRDQGSARRWKGWKMLLGIIMSPRLLLRPEKSSCTALYILLHSPQSITHIAAIQSRLSIQN